MLGNIGLAILLLFTLTRSNIAQYMTVRLYREKLKRIQCQTNETIDFKEDIDWCRESRNVCRRTYVSRIICAGARFSKTAKVNCANGNDCQIQQQEGKSSCDREYLRVQYICKKRAPAQTLQPTISTTVKTVFKTEKNGNVSLIPKTDAIQLKGYMTVRLYQEKVKRIQCETNEIIDFKEDIDWCRESRNVCRSLYLKNATCDRGRFSKSAKVNCTNGNDCQIQQKEFESFCDREYLRVEYICKKRGMATTETSTSKKENTGKIIATTISILVLLTTIVGLVFAYRKWKNRKKLAANDAPPRYVNGDVVVPMKQIGDVVASAKSTETDFNESICCSTVENSRQPVQSQPSKNYAELELEGGRIGGNEKVKTEQHYQEVENDHEYDDVRRK